MSDWIEVDFLGVETNKSGDAIAVRYFVNGVQQVHVVDGGYVDTGDQIVEHLKQHYGTTKVDHVVLTHSDQDHANGLRAVLEQCQVGALWMNRPWLYATELLPHFTTYTDAGRLASRLRSVYAAPAALEDIAREKGIPIYEAFQGTQIGQFKVVTPSRARYLQLVIESDKTPATESLEGILKSALDSVARFAMDAVNLVRAAWGDEVFPASGTSSENEMSVVQYALVNDRRVLLTGDTGRDGLKEAADYLEYGGVALPGFWVFQVPHHGGRHNVNSELLDRLAGPKLSGPPASYSWNAICSSAKADVHHPKKSVKRAFMHRGAHWSETEGRPVHVASGITREGWTAIPQADYPTDQESD